ncbi:acetyl-CoA C-acetyltransferase [Paraburkholderia sacchari]|uniref:acetyl-CoA C-acetyltransferase n=1 Tax=Paraburkholderia sacchari TaxID=159450 RepID=UPI001BCD8F1E|nr:acetyl-CoA C-acetyltransferase [Paraburkholderia sacchari]
MQQAFIYDHVRTPRGKGKPDGSLHEVTPVWLARAPLVALRERNALDTAALDEVVMGCVVPVGEQGGNIARMAVLDADYAHTVPALSINRACGSGLDAVAFAAAKVMAGQASLAIGGGVESMSRVPMGADGGAWAQDPQVASKTNFVMQGVSADLLASLHGYSREDVDAYAAESHRRAAHAWAEGRFARSVVAVRDSIGMTLLDRDETIRPETSVSSLAALRPAFAEMGRNYGYDGVALQRYAQLERVEHVHHAGNSSGIVDGAAGVLLGSAEAGAQLGLKPRARIRGFASIGSEPTLMLDGPSHAAKKALAQSGMSVADIDLWELNEAFSSVVLCFMDALGIAHERINVNGGAIAMGHPLGATGAMILGTALDELERSGQSTALVSLCVAAGMGTAMIIERV